MIPFVLLLILLNCITATSSTFPYAILPDNFLSLYHSNNKRQRNYIPEIVVLFRGGSNGGDDRYNIDDGQDDELTDYDADVDDNVDSQTVELDSTPIDWTTNNKNNNNDKSSPPRRPSSGSDGNFWNASDYPKRRGPSSPIRQKKPSQHWTQRIASQGIKMGSQLAWGAVQQTGNVAYQLVKPRHVDPSELRGLWRIDQQIVSNGVDLASVATVEMDPQQRYLTLKLPDGKVIVESYTFRKTRLGSYKTEFVAPAFLLGATPRLYGYRGTWQRKLADKRVIKLVGKIYSVKKQRFGKDKGKYHFAQPVGTFVARRRMKLSEDDSDDELSEVDESDGEYEGRFDHNDVDTDGPLDEDYDEDETDE